MGVSSPAQTPPLPDLDPCLLRRTWDQRCCAEAGGVALAAPGLPAAVFCMGLGERPGLVQPWRSEEELSDVKTC